MTRNGGEVESVERFEIGGSTQWALVRGRNSRSPVLLLVQAGPGFPIIHEARALEAALHLEDDFRVVYWDQRGSGKSFDAGAPKSPLRLDDLVGDLCALIHALCDRLAVFQVDVVGFSLGASLAAIAAARDPEPIRSVTAVGPDVNLGEAERFAYAFALTEAGRRSNRRALLALRAIGPPPHIDFRRFLERVKWVSNFGGVQRRASFGSLVRTHVLRLLTSPHYSLREAVGAIRGMRSMQERLLTDLQGLDLFSRAPRIAVPIAVFQGRLDAAAPPELTRRYHDQLDAPRGKTLVWFEHSAHMPHVDEPELFRRHLLERTGRMRPEKSR